MTKFVYTPALAAIAKGEIDLATDDIRAALVMTNTTADTDEDAEFVGDVGTLDEYNGAGYARQALTTQVVTANLGADQAEFTAGYVDLPDPSGGVAVGTGRDPVKACHEQRRQSNHRLQR
jgi:hypothetical protein